MTAKDRGYLYERTQWNALEASFARRWEEENKPRPGINYGQGLLQDLFMGSATPGSWDDLMNLPNRMITESERYVAATVVQWLGTNCGMSFLDQVLRENGLVIVRRADKKETIEPPPKRPPLRKMDLTI